MDNFFSTNLKYLREKRGITQEALSKQLGVSLGSISHWEKGLRTPNMDMIVNIANYFHVNEDIIFKDLKQQDNRDTVFTTHIYKGDLYSVDLVSQVPFENLSEKEKKTMIEHVMDELYEYKREFTNRDH